MTGEHLRDLFTTVFDRGELTRLAAHYELARRERDIDVVEFLVALVLTAGTHEGGRQYDVLRTYVENGNPPVKRQSFYAWFHDPLVHVLEAMLASAIARGLEQPKLLPGSLGSVTDWRVVDSTTIRLPNAAAGDFPGAGEYAAVKIHKEYSLGCGNLVSYAFGPSREHDSRYFTIDERRRGTGVLADLAYASFAMMRACETQYVKYVIRLKEGWKPKVDRLLRGAVTAEVGIGDDFDVLLANDVVLLEGRSIDCDVTLGKGPDAVASRLVGVPTPKGYCFFLTNLSRVTHGPLQVGELYRCRWEIEIDNKLEKTGARLDEICASKPASIRSLLLASMLNATLARIVVQSEKVAIRKGKKENEPAGRAPLHGILVLKALASAHGTLTRLLFEEQVSLLEWNRLMSRLRHFGEDPSWRLRPSVLDRLQGLTAPPPGRLKKQAKVA